MAEGESELRDRNLYVPLGDSITCGYAASRSDAAFAWRLLQRLREANLAEQMRSVARPSWTALHLWHAVAQVPQAIWAQTSVVTVLVGGNDLRRRYYAVLGHPAPGSVIDRALEGYSFALGRVCSLLREAGVPKVVLGTLFNPIPHSPLAAHAFSRVNEVVRKLARQHGFAVAEIHAAYGGREPALIHRYRTGRLEDLSLPFARPVHPNDSGHAVISDVFWDAIAGRRAARDVAWAVDGRP
jgi:lysophospholipase L1-like esterase